MELEAEEAVSENTNNAVDTVEDDKRRVLDIHAVTANTATDIKVSFFFSPPNHSSYPELLCIFTCKCLMLYQQSIPSDFLA